MGLVPLDFYDFRLFEKSLDDLVLASWPGIYRVFGLTVPKSDFRVCRVAGQLARAVAGVPT